MLCGEYALSRLGCTTTVPYTVQAWSDIKNACGIKTVFVEYYYMENINLVGDVTPLEKNNYVLMPSVSRALIEAVENINYFDEGVVFESVVRGGGAMMK